MVAIVVQGQGPLEGGGLTGGVTAELGGPSFGSPSVGGGFTACVPLDSGGAASFPLEFGGQSVGNPCVGSPFARSFLFINFLRWGLAETDIPATFTLGEKGLHSLIILSCILSFRSHS